MRKIGKRRRSSLAVLAIFLVCLVSFQNCSSSFQVADNSAKELSSLSVSCATNEHLEGSLCSSNKKSCFVQNGRGEQVWDETTYGSCVAVACDLNYHPEDRACISNKKSCSALNAASASQAWNGSGYESCQITQCNANYYLSANSCIYNSQACPIPNGTGWTQSDGSCKLASCIADFHSNGNSCETNKKICSISNASLAQQTWNGSQYGACLAIACNPNFHLNGNSCESNSLACPITNGQGLQYWNGSSYGACLIASCNAGFSNKSGACVDSNPRVAAYHSVVQDVEVSSQRVLLQTTITNHTASSMNLLITAEGRFYLGNQGPAQAIVTLWMDGRIVGNRPVMDWRKSEAPVQHSYSAIASVSSEPGSHLIELRAENSGAGSFFVGAGSNLAVLQSSASTMQTSTLAQDTNLIEETRPFDPAHPNAFTIFPILSLPHPVQGPSAILFSGRVYQAGKGGDSMVGLNFGDSSCPFTGEQSWSVNDTFTGAEVQSPVFSQGIYARTGTTQPNVIAAAFPWPLQQMIDPVQFFVGGNSTMISIEQPRILGMGYHPEFSNQACDTLAYAAVPTNGSRAIVASADFTIPAGHDGIVQFLAKTRIQSSDNDSGIHFMGLSIDGVDVGFVGVQEVRAPYGMSQRTVNASYLSANAPLAPGAHHVSVWRKSTGQFEASWTNKDLTLLYFD